MTGEAPWLRQDGFDIRFDWGMDGLRNLASDDRITVLVDVLSFTTCVSVAMDRNASVHPYRYHDDSARPYAASLGAHLAGSRKYRTGFSLSPASLARLQDSDRIVLPSPNGSALSLEAKGKIILAGCLRNCEAVAAFLNRTRLGVTIIAAGERWPNGTLRPALEDYLGAGALLSRLNGTRSPEAELAAEAFQSNQTQITDRIQASASGKELIEWSYADDVRIACEIGTSLHVPILVDAHYRRATPADLDAIHR